MILDACPQAKDRVQESGNGRRPVPNARCPAPGAGPGTPSAPDCGGHHGRSRRPSRQSCQRWFPAADCRPAPATVRSCSRPVGPARQDAASRTGALRKRPSSRTAEQRSGEQTFSPKPPACAPRLMPCPDRKATPDRTAWHGKTSGVPRAAVSALRSPVVGGPWNLPAMSKPRRRDSDGKAPGTSCRNTRKKVPQAEAVSRPAPPDGSTHLRQGLRK